MVRTVSSDRQVVMGVLRDAEAYPAEEHTAASRKMLADGLGYALPTAGSAELNGFRPQFLGLVGGFLADVQRSAQGALEACNAATAKAEAQCKDAEAAREAAATVTGAARADVDAQQGTLTEAQGAVSAAELDFEELEKAKEAVLKTRAEIKSQREAIASIATAMKQYENDETTAPPTDKVMEFLGTLHTEKALLAAAPSAIALKPAARGAFDTVTVDEVKRIVAEELAAVEEKLAAGDKEEAYATSEALGSWAILDVSRERVGECAGQLLEAKVKLTEAEVAERGAGQAAEEASNNSSAELAKRVLVEARVKEVEAAIVAFEKISNPPAEPASADVPMDGDAAMEDVSKA